jgi:hypothetical protein
MSTTQWPGQDRRADKRSVICGVPFVQVGLGQDTGKCLICGQLVDVGYELREHAREHGGERERREEQ